jgi:hypothetical protein
MLPTVRDTLQAIVDAPGESIPDIVEQVRAALAEQAGPPNVRRCVIVIDLPPESTVDDLTRVLSDYVDGAAEQPQDVPRDGLVTHWAVLNWDTDELDPVEEDNDELDS